MNIIIIKVIILKPKIAVVLKGKKSSESIKNIAIRRIGNCNAVV